MAWIELTLTLSEFHDARGETPEAFVARVLTSAGFELETVQGRRLLVEPYKVKRDTLDRWITYRQWTGPGAPGLEPGRS